ncbi:ribokinase [Trueperella sp. LYQ141]|uniref:ribokinase n=1 Tax=Trueperella sp. LYQ141 TaxID=3391058 RepID=UPI0039835712
MYDVMVIGSSNLDTVLSVPTIPKPGETILGYTIDKIGGGKGANQAVAAARAGAKTAFLSAFGQDEAGAMLRAALEGDGIDVSSSVSSAQPTGAAYIAVSEDGENSIVVIAGANQSEELLEGAKDLEIEARVILFSLEIPMRVVQAALERVGDAKVIINVAPVTDLPADVARRVDVLVVNEHEGAALAEHTDRGEIIEILGATYPAVVMTLGKNGALVAEQGNDSVLIEPYEVCAVDSTGAGDTFCGYVAAGLARGDTLVEAVRRATIAGALCVTKKGAQPAIPYLDDVINAEEQ